MKAKLVDRSNPLNQSFSTSYLDEKYFFKVWHYHPELELVIILESKGTQFVGDSIERFKDGDVLLIGKNLPHLMLNDIEYFEDGSMLPARAIVINFERYFTGNTFLSLPEMKSINTFLSLSERGIKFSGPIKQYVREMALTILSSKGFERILLFIKLLHTISNTSEYRLLSSAAFSISVGNIEKSRMGKVYDYVMNNFDKAISLKKVAEIVHMNPTAFSRYFKQNHKENFTQYVNEVRIRFACKLLLEKKLNVSEICYRAGYNNISNFNRQFRIIKGVSPKEYIRSYTPLSTNKKQ
ncbi:AraC family transcriptional regulator [Flagellimonas sp. S3867]|uniref:AraC family transcriptional regulator n=1 Tax=Flagellimonas sp. S3867 TaxID=2768063 RepID=UPI0016852556|nr:AraC family transcriptional regulator [Flagellimonas sp. S3867]